tara:strand:- start:3 stop:935 length:933 start_codon:yes stop_codon:yes gene_type:complete
MFLVAALYKFSTVNNPSILQLDFRKKLKDLSIYGTILIGKEGLNGTISGSKENIERAISFIKKLPNFHDIDIKYSQSNINPFIRLKIKLKEEIVTIGDKTIDPVNISGNYINPEDWNELINDKNIILIDTRNDYEYSIGTFKNAINPKTFKFREFPEWLEKQNFSKSDKKNKKIAMFCTGGIRCEKASSLLKKDGFNDVNHLKGGILNYFKKVDIKDSLWEGECFVFDDRVSVKHDLTEGSYDMCHGCRMPITNEDKATDEYIKGVACPSCFFEKTEEQRARYMSRQKQIDLAKERNQKHIGPKDKELKK